MATMNPFDLLVDDDNEDPNQLASAQRSAPALPSKKAPAPVQPAKPAKLPSKPLPPAQAVRESKNENSRGRGGGRGFGRGRGGGGGGFNRDSANNENGGRNGSSDRYQAPEDGEKAAERRGYGGPRGSFRGPRRGGFSNGEAEEGERPRRVYERRSGTGRGNEFKRDGAGRRNWGAAGDENAPDVEEPVAENEKNVAPEQQLGEDGVVDDSNKAEEAVKEPEEKEPEDKEMTLKEYEKLREESRKLLGKAEVRKAEVDEELENMQQLSSKKTNEEIFAKLGTDNKDKRKEIAGKEEKAKKSVTITEFLKPAEGERYYNPGGRGRGRGRGSRGGFNNGSNRMNVAAPSIEDPGQFPSLNAK